MSLPGRRPPVTGLALVLSVALVSAVANAGPMVDTSGDATTARAPAAGSASSARAARIREQKLLNIPLTTHEGRSVRFYDDLVKGRVVALHFMFTTCGSGCPLTTANLAQVRKALTDRDRDVTFLSISLDPEHDTPEVLRAYARAYGLGPGWYFLTGERADIERLRRKLGAYDLDPRIDADLRQHVGLVILGNEPVGRWITLPALSNPVRIRQAIERTILPPDQWSTGRAAIDDALTEHPMTAAPTGHIHPPEPR